MASAAIALSIWAGILIASRDFALLLAILLATLLIFRTKSALPLAGAALLGGAILSVHIHALSDSVLADQFGKTAQISGTVTSDPRATRERVIGSRLLPSRYSFTLRATEIEIDGARYRLRVPIRVITDGDAPYFPGEEISFVGRVVESRERDVAALIIASGEIDLISKAGRIRAGLEKLRSKLRERAALIGRDSGALLPGLALGDTSLQSREFEEVMRRAGLSHLTAVSGANFAIVSAFIFSIVGWIIPRLGLQITITGATLALFIILVRPTPSVLRAAVMAGIFLLARASGRRRQAASALAVAVAILLLLNPFQAFEPGFILSVSATSGLIFLAPHIEKKLAELLPRALAEIFAVAAAASICCAPYLLFISESVGAGTVISNVLVAPIIPIVTILVFLAAVVVLPAPVISDFLLWLANFGAAWIVQVADWNEVAPQFSTSPALAIFILISGAIYWRTRRIWAIFLVMALIISASSSRIYFPGQNWRIGQCDVGQGDALLINLGDGVGALFDAGPEPALLERCLEIFGIKELALVVISHQHADHYAGLSGIGSREIGEVWSNGSAEFESNANLRKVSADLEGRVGPLQVRVLWPRTNEMNFEALAGDGSAENNRSIVLHVEIEGVNLLVTGDIEPGAQEQIAQEADLAEIDLLKVSHHGSRFQSDDFLIEVSPEISLVSVGANSYGHPDPELLTRLSSLGSKVFRTDRDGAIAISWQQQEGKPIFSARTLGRKWWQISWR